MTTKFQRRKLLKVIGTTGAVGLVGGLAGCTSSAQSDGAGATATPTATEASSDGEEWTATNTIDMNDELAFAPTHVEVEAGTTVTWTTTGAVGHTVTAYEDGIPEGAAYFASGGFDSEQAAKDGYPEKGNVTEGKSYEHTFETKGTYEYYCVPHEMNGMIGYVKVI